MTVAALLEVMKPRHAALSASSLPCAPPCCSFFLSPSSSSGGGSSGQSSLPPPSLPPVPPPQLSSSAVQHSTAQHANREQLTNSAPVKVPHSLAVMLTRNNNNAFSMSLNYLYSHAPTFLFVSTLLHFSKKKCVQSCKG